MENNKHKPVSAKIMKQLGFYDPKIGKYNGFNSIGKLYDSLTDEQKKLHDELLKKTIK